MERTKKTIIISIIAHFCLIVVLFYAKVVKYKYKILGYDNKR